LTIHRARDFSSRSLHLIFSIDFIHTSLYSFRENAVSGKNFFTQPSSWVLQEAITQLIFISRTFCQGEDFSSMALDFSALSVFLCRTPATVLLPPARRRYPLRRFGLQKSWLPVFISSRRRPWDSSNTLPCSLSSLFLSFPDELPWRPRLSRYPGSSPRTALGPAPAPASCAPWRFLRARSSAASFPQPRHAACLPMRSIQFVSSLDARSAACRSTLRRARVLCFLLAVPTSPAMELAEPSPAVPPPVARPCACVFSRRPCVARAFLPVHASSRVSPVFPPCVREISLLAGALGPCSTVPLFVCTRQAPVLNLAPC
jgi:hypothetical protein